ncbi:FmdB family zinc ribbon protein [Luteococcus sp. Sow4_B9]|uniref:FmdB family zinc ribbon protein n=1 Tax=Luteococcus sp. Sow4_B9 TaxID=3438792 RepID=UPI003F9CA252
MPTYQYRCTECGVEIERVQKFSDPALTVCEDCGGTLRKVYNAVGIVFKGSGFYATDNRTKGKAAAATGSSESSSSSDSSGSSSTGSDSGSSNSGSSSSAASSSTSGSASSTSKSTSSST